MNNTERERRKNWKKSRQTDESITRTKEKKKTHREYVQDRINCVAR
jgi:hypothetical protein